MEKIKIESDENSIYIDCPHCDAWEGLGIDDSRRLHYMRIVEWRPYIYGENEFSIHQCTQCKSNFEVEWDYNNAI